MKVDVLDHGYVRLVNSMGTEVDIANAVAEFVQEQYPITMEAWNAR